MMTNELDDFTLGQTIGWAWAAGLLFAIGYEGKLVEHGDLDRLARDILNSVPGFAADEVQPSQRLLEGLRQALDEACGDGLIYLSGADLVQ